MSFVQPFFSTLDNIFFFLIKRLPQIPDIQTKCSDEHQKKGRGQENISSFMPGRQ